MKIKFSVVGTLSCLFACSLLAEWARPDLVAKVAAGELREARASWWGFDKDDSTRFLQAAITSGVRKLVVDRMDSPWIVTPIKAASNQHLVFENGVLLLAKRGAFVGRSERLLAVNDVTNVCITGYGATLRMWRDDYARGKDGRGRDYRRGEWRHTMSINGSRNVVVEGLTLEESGGDGIYISSKTPETTSRDIVIRDCVCDRHHRQGLSVISARNLLVENCVFKNTKGTAPEDGVDFEPNDAGEHFVNCVLRNCVSENNAGSGFEFALSASRASTEPCSIVLENCRSTGDRDFGVKVRTRVRVQDGDYPSGTIAFKACTFEKCGFQAVDIHQNPERAIAVSFANCTFRQIGTKNPDAPLVCLESLFPDDPKPAMPSMTGIDWPDRGSRPYYLYDTMNFAAIGEETLPVLAADTAGAEVVDRCPGKVVSVSSPRFRHRMRLVAYADCARRVTICGVQSRVGPPSRQPTRQPVKVCDAAGKVVATIPLVEFGPSDLSFDAPAMGFYSLEVLLGGHAYAVTATDAPLAVDGTPWSDRHQVRTLSPISSKGSLYVPVRAGDRAEFRVRGSQPNEMVAVTIVDPSGTVAFKNEAVLCWTHYLTPVATADGLWKMTIGKPCAGAFEDVGAMLAGVRPFLFLSPEKYWSSNPAVR